MTISLIEPHKTGRVADDDLALRLAKGFQTTENGNFALLIRPSDPMEKILEGPRPFCEAEAIARYDKAKPESGPVSIQISGVNWAFNSNELLTHADQSRFESGLFEDSPDVYLTASKGRVLIQFVCKPHGLRFFRAIYLRPD